MTVVFLVLTAAVALVWGHEKLMSQDEMYAFQTDSVGSVARLVEVQREWPISLDPLLVHLLSHGAMRVFGVGAFALRFPALLGFLLMQVCLFFFVRNLAGERAGMVAAAFPAMTGTLFYAAEGRPYGVMLGTYALAMLCWQVAVRQGPGARGQGPEDLQPARRESGRGWALVGLALAIAATVNAHYFGVLLLVPVGAAEVYRTWRRRAVDWPVVGAVCLGTAGFVGAVPFLKGAGEFKQHYYNAGTVGLHDITRAYRSIFLDYTKKSMTLQHLAMVALVAFAVALVWGCMRSVLRQRQTQIPFGDDKQRGAEWVMVLALAGLPFCGYLLARFVTHSIEVRYVLGAVVAISAMVGVAVSEWVRRHGVFSAVVGVMLVGVLGIGAMEVQAERRTAAATRAELVLSPEVTWALNGDSDGTLYVQDMGRFEVASYYADAATRARLALVYSRDEELRWNGHDTMALTAEHLGRFTGLRVVRYEDLRRVPGEHVFAMFHTGWDWTDQAFAEDGATVRSVGMAMDGDVAGVRFSGK